MLRCRCAKKKSFIISLPVAISVRDQVEIFVEKIGRTATFLLWKARSMHVMLRSPQIVGLRPLLHNKIINNC
jgi:hypothetical protein